MWPTPLPCGEPMVTALACPAHQREMASSARRWHGVLRAVARAAPQRPMQRALPHTARVFTVPTQSLAQSRSFSAQANSQTVSPEWPTIDHKELASPGASPSPPLQEPTGTKPSSNRTLRNVVFSPDSTFADAQQAFQQLQTRDLRITGRHYAALMEKANVERRYGTVRALFAEFCSALDAQRVVAYKTPKTTWEYHTSERLQMHRHVLWAMLRGAPANTRTRSMQRHFRKHELGKSNRIGVYETDALSFLLRMECIFKFAAQREDAGDESLKRKTLKEDAWLERVTAILEQMRLLKFNASHSSVHALFHFLMHRPDVALAHADKSTEEETEDQVIQRVLFNLLDTYPRVLERNPRLVSLAVSTAASAGRIGLAIHLLIDAEQRKISVDAASFAHVVASTKDEDKRVEIAELYMRAKDMDRIHEGDDNHAMKNYLLQYAIHDGNFAQTMELLHEMEFHKIAATSRTVTELLVSIASYRLRIRWKLQEAEVDSTRESRLKKALKVCPTIPELVHTFPTAIPNDLHTCSLAVLQALRGGDIDDALKVLRAASSLPLRADVYSQLLYALLASEAHAKRDALAVREVEKLYDTHYVGEGKREYLNAQLLNLCESNQDFVTAVAVLDNWQASTRSPLSKRSAKRVFEVVSKQLKAVQAASEGPSQSFLEEEEEMVGVRYKVGGAELSYRGILERYPVLIPVDAWSLGHALMRSATAGLVEDVVTLLQVAQQQNLELEPVAYKASLDVLQTTAQKDNGDAATREALRDCIAAMKEKGTWSVLTERYPEFTAQLDQ